MGESNNKKTEILSIIAVILIILGAVFYFTAQNYKIPKQGQEKTTSDTSLPVAPQEQVYNPAEKLPDTNPYDAKTNPFEEAKTNPFKDIYKNPFSK